MFGLGTGPVLPEFLPPESEAKYLGGVHWVSFRIIHCYVIF